MKITVENALTEYPKYQGVMSPEVKQVWEKEEFKEMFEFYGESPKITECIDEWLSQVNECIADNGGDDEPEEPEESEPEHEPSAEPEPEQESAPKPKKRSPKSSGAKYEAESVNQVSPEVSIIARFVRLHGEVANMTNHDKARRILGALQKAIVSHQIRKTSKYADEVMAVQKQLVSIVNKGRTGDDIKVSGIENLRKIAHSETRKKVVSCIKSYVSIVGKTGEEKKAGALLERLETLKDFYEFEDEVKEMLSSLRKYVKDDSEPLKASEQTLRGLCGLAGIGHTPTTKKKTPMSLFS